MASELFAELASVGFIVSSGDLGENVTTEGLDLTSFPLGTRLRIGDSAIVELTGLRPGRYYYYRFRAAGYQSPIGRTQTAQSLRRFARR